MLLLSLMIVLLAAAVNPAQGQEIKATGNSVILTCSGGEDGEVTWRKDDKEIDKEKNKKYEVPAERGIVEGSYFCEYSDVKDMFYLRVIVCESCYEMNGSMIWSIILTDILITGGVILFFYCCATRNSNGTQKKASNSRAVNPPRPPNPDYEGNFVYKFVKRQASTILNKSTSRKKEAGKKNRNGNGKKVFSTQQNDNKAGLNLK